MFRCRISIAIVLALTLPLQLSASGSCCQAGQESCCSAPAEKSDAQSKSCCSHVETQSTGCKHCAAAKAQSSQSSLERCTCHCKENPSDRQVTKSRRELYFESILASQDAIFSDAQTPTPAPLKVEFTGQSPRLRLHAIHCVWLN
jgi:hypothetical protein